MTTVTHTCTHKIQTQTHTHTRTHTHTHTHKYIHTPTPTPVARYCVCVAMSSLSLTQSHSISLSLGVLACVSGGDDALLEGADENSWQSRPRNAFASSAFLTPSSRPARSLCDTTASHCTATVMVMRTRHGHRQDHECVCVYYCRTYYKAVRGGGEEESGGDVL